jgi:hypothetical protein
MTAKRPASKRPKKPVSAGDRLRAAITDEFDLSEPEMQLLAKACSTADLLERVEREITTGPLVVEGSRQQQVSNPLIASMVQLQAHLVALLGALGVPLGEVEDPEEATVSRQARRAALIRWHGRAG